MRPWILAFSMLLTFNLYRGPLAGMATNGTDIGSGAPAPGSVWGYLVTGENALGEGTLGDDSDDAARNATSPCGV